MGSSYNKKALTFNYDYIISEVGFIRRETDWYTTNRRLNLWQ